MKKLKPVKSVARDHMNWTVSLAKDPDYLYVVLKGRFELSEFNEMLDDVCDLKAGLPEFPVLFSDLEFEVGEMKKKELASVSTHFITKNPALAKSKVAIVMKTDKDFETADSWKIITQPASSARLSIFRNERNARKWLARSG